MAGDWIKIEHALPDKPEVMQMADLLGIDPDAVVGKLLRFWNWCDVQCVNGDALSVTKTFLDRITFCKNFAAAMIRVGWLVEDGETLSIANFDRHNGKTSKLRALANRRVAKNRQCNAPSVTNVTLPPLQKALPEKRREEKSLEERHNPAAGAEALCTIEQAKAYAPSVKFTEADAERWWHTRNASGWTKGSVNGGAARRITSWQSDMATSAGWVKQSASYGQGQGKSRPQHFAGIVENLEIPT